MTTVRIISGSGGGGKGSSSVGRTPSEAADNLDSKQYAYLIDLISEGEIQGLVNGAQSIYFDDTPLQNPDGSYNFKDVTITLRNGTQLQESISMPGGIENEIPVGVEVNQTTSVVRTITNTNVNAARITISVPQLQEYTNEGDINGASLSLAIQVQYNGGGYTTAINDTITGRTNDLYQRDYIVELTGAFPVEIKVVRTSSDSTSSKLLNAFQWSSYTEIIRAKLSYPNSALVGVVADSAQFSSIPRRSYRIRGIKIPIPSNATVDQSNGRLIYDGIWDGTFGAAQWCSDPAWILYELMINPRFGTGDHILAPQLDKFAFYSASQYCSALVPDGFGGTEPRFSCNTNIQTSEEVYKIINDLCSVMRCMPYWSSGFVTIAQDKPVDTSYLLTLANVTEAGFSYQGSSRKIRPTVCVVSYLDLTTRDINYEVVEDEDGIRKYGIIKTEISAFACTSRGQARRMGEWMLYSERYESEVISFAVGVDAGVTLRPGQVIEVSDPVRAGARRGGRISAATAAVITVDDADTLAPEGAELSVIMPDATVEKRGISSISGNAITLSSPLSTAPNPNSVWLYETSNIQPSSWRVLSVGEQNGIDYEVSAIAYNASKYDYIERDVPLVQRDVTDLNIIPASPTDLTAREVLFDAGGIAKAKLELGWKSVSGVSEYRVEWRKDDGNWSSHTAQAPSYEIIDTTEGRYEIKVYSISPGNLRSSVDPAQLTTQAFGKTEPPATPSGLSIIPNGDTTAILSWDRATELDVLLGGKVLIRHSTLLTGAVWQDSQDVVAAAAGSQTQKQVPLLEGTYLIKFEDDGGRRSAAAATAAVDLPTPQPRLLVQSYREDQETPPFNGTTNGMAYSAELDGLFISLGAFIDDLATDGNWDALPPIDSLSSNLGTGEYEFESTHDLGGVFDLNLRRYLVSSPFQLGDLWDDQQDLIDTWPDIDGDVFDQVNAALYVRSTADDPAGSPTWSSWHELVNGIVRGRGFQFKLQATSYAEAQNIIVSELGAELELQQRSEVSATITSGAATYATTYSEPFYQAPAIGVTAYNLATGDYYAITSQTRTGFSITFYNSTGTVISRQFAYTATGYGREVI